MKNNQQSKEHLANFHIAGFTYYDGAEAFSSLAIGLELDIAIDEGNTYDARAVQLQFNDWKLGYIPREHNRIFYKLLKTGLGSHIKVRIQSLDASNHPESQVRVVAHLIN